MSKTLVTGGCGTIGKFLVDELQRRGHSVVSCDVMHNENEYSYSIVPNVDVRKSIYVRCDVGEYRQLENVFTKLGPFDYVYHAAAEFGRWNGEDFYETLWRTNVVGTKHIIRLQERYGFRLIHFSSSEVYGDYPALMVEPVLDIYPIKQLNDYAMTKLVNEMQVANSVKQRGTESVVVRIFNTYGPGEYYSPYRSVNCRFMYCALRGIPWVVHRGHTRTSTYLQDTVCTLANIADRFVPSEVYNIGGDQRHTIEELSDKILCVTGASPTLVSYKDSEPMTTLNKIVDTSRSVRDLVHRNTVSLEEGLRITADWMRNVYNIK